MNWKLTLPMVFLLSLSSAMGMDESYNPFDHPEQWRQHLDSTRHPITVYWSFKKDTTVARQVLVELEKAWDWQVDGLGFRAPPVPVGTFAAGRLATFLIRGVNGNVEIDEGGGSYITYDPWSKYGGAMLPATIQHEFSHTVQAAYSWEESDAIYEMTSNYIQEKFRPGLNSQFHRELHDFQARPEWPVDYNDGYETYFMYGASLYLFFLETRYFDGSPAFLPLIWEQVARFHANVKGSDFWRRSVASVLPAGVTYSDTLLEFARWRYFTGSFAGPSWRGIPYSPAYEDNLGIRYTLTTQSPIIHTKELLMQGTTYVRLAGVSSGSAGELADHGGRAYCFKGDNKALWAVQVIAPGSPEDGKRFFSRGNETVRLVFSGLHKELILAITPYSWKHGGMDIDLKPLEINLAAETAKLHSRQPKTYPR